MGSNGARIFVMPATDPINPNVHPLIYRWNGILGQSQAAALEAAGKEGIIYNSTYTNFWQGAMAWSGWWHNQIGLLTEVASARVAAPIEQQRAVPGRPAPAGGRRRPRRGGGRGQQFTDAPLPPPTDINSRTEYPRPWMGGRWTLRDIVDYELIATMALLETAADRRETLLRQIYEVNRQTIEDGKKGDAVGDPGAGRAPARSARGRAPGREAAAWAASRSTAPTRRSRPTASTTRAGTFVIPMTQVFARYAKDMLEKQTYPEVRRGPERAARAAVRRDRVVARHAARRRHACSSSNPLPAMKMTQGRRRAEDRRRGHRQRHALRVRLQGPRHRDRDQPAAEGRRARRASTARRTWRSTGVSRAKIEHGREGLRARR